MLRKFLFNSQFYVYSAYFPTLLSIITLPFITPYLTLRDYGLYGILFSIYNFVSIVFNLGIAVENQNSFFNAPDNYKEKWGRTLGFQLIWNFISSGPLICITIIFNINELKYSELLIIIPCLLISYIFLDPLKVMGSRFMQYNNRHKGLFYITIFATVLQFATILVLILKFEIGFIAWFVGNTINSLITASIFWYLLKKNEIKLKVNFSMIDLIQRIRKQSTIILHNVSGFVLDASDRILLSLFQVPIGQIGSYNIAYNYSNYGQTVNGAFNTVFSPMYFKSITEKDKEYDLPEIKKLFKIWLSIMFFVCMNMIIWGDWLFSFLYRNNELKTVYLLSFPMIIALLYRPFYVMVVDNLIIQEKTKYVAFISVSSAMLNIILNIIFIQKYGIYAAIFSTCFAYLYMGFIGLTVPAIKKELTHTYHKHYFMMFFAIIFLMVLVCFIDFEPITTKIVSFSLVIIILVMLNLDLISNTFKPKLKTA